MLVVNVALRVPLADQLEFLERTKTLIAASRSEVGVIAYSFAIDIIDCELFRIFELYKDRVALEDHMASDHFKSWRSHTGSYERVERYVLDAI